jgi:hypothetical protein
VHAAGAMCVVVGHLFATLASAWSEPSAPFRRSIQVALDPRQINGDETALAMFLAPGLAAKDASDLRVAADNGVLVPATIIRGGRDDRVVLIFNPTKGNATYHAYWGDAKPARPAPAATVTSGLLVEFKRPAQGPKNSTADLAKLYDRSGDVIARGMIDRMFVGYNAGGIEGESIARITGTIFAPIEGEYHLALSADDRGGLRINGKDTLFAPGFPEDIRFNTTLNLKRGSHKFEYFHYDAGGDWRVSLGWRRPDTPRIDVVAADAFGHFARTKAGPLERNKQPVTADFDVAWLGECIVADRSSYRLRFEAQFPPKATNIRATWDFGDGQTASGTRVDHVFLSPGRYAITLDLRTTQGSDTRTFHLNIARDPARPVDPATDAPRQQADLVARFDFPKLNSLQQAMAVRILARGKAVESLMSAVSAACATRKHDDQQWTVDALVEAFELAVEKKQVEALAAAMANLPAQSNLHPKAADLHADLLLWYAADFKAAQQMLSAFKDRKSNNLKRLYMHALLLSGEVDAARRVLGELPQNEEIGRRVALSGALARSIEYFIDNDEPDAAAEQWDDWQRRYPESFWEGYSVLLKVRMLESRFPDAAARIAEAFARAVPDSPYAPQLLARASDLLAKSDANKSEALRKLLKERYPEDPLSQ